MTYCHSVIFVHTGYSITIWSMESTSLAFVAVSLFCVACAAYGSNSTSQEPAVITPTPIATEQPNEQTTESGLPGFTLYKGSRICFRAYFSLKVVVRYRTEEFGDKTKFLNATITPEHPLANGTCKASATIFNLFWADGNYSLTFYFQQMNEKIKTGTAHLSTWSSPKVSLTLLATPENQFPGIVSAGAYTMETDVNDVHFSAPLNFSYACTTQEDIFLHPIVENGDDVSRVIQSSVVSLWDVKIQAFQLPETGVFSESVTCKADLESNVPEQNVVPLVVAACLAALILGIVIIYFIIKNRANTQYSAME